ncbi:hypothetical protein [Trinickia mobilis]|uniref:hypothetical protein n=1 Tax=Trinickia mobilis TaxID=2816356 RepID=UPI001A8F9871|nr:hypothetical protein [Trinickia mobilis]
MNVSISVVRHDALIERIENPVLDEVPPLHRHAGQNARERDVTLARPFRFECAAVGAEVERRRVADTRSASRSIGSP